MLAHVARFFILMLMYYEIENQVAMYLFPVVYIAWTIAFFAIIICQDKANQTKLVNLPIFLDDDDE